MTLLQVILIVTGFIFFLISLDLFQRKKFTLLHFLVFFGGTALVVLFTFDQSILDRFGKFFGIARGADLIVYISVIGLCYLYFELINKINMQDVQFTELSRSVSISSAQGNLVGDCTLIFLIASYGEDKTVLETVSNVIKQGYNVVLVDDGENKVNLQEGLVSHIKNGSCVLLTHPLNMGQGAALQTATEYVLQKIPDLEYVVHFDADGQHRIEDIDNYLKAFGEDPTLDIVLGSRFLGGSQMSSRRRFHKKIQVLFMELFVGLRLTDTNNGYRVIRKSALPKLKITLNRFAHASEIEHLIKRNMLKYREVPIVIRYTEYSLSKGQSLGNAWGIFKRLMWKRFISK